MTKGLGRKSHKIWNKFYHNEEVISLNSNAKRNMIQVRLSDDELKEFEAVKAGLKEKNNAATLRKLIQLAPLMGKKPQAEVEHLLKQYDDLDAKASALLWDSSNVTKNLNEIAHVTNIAKNNDPADATTWNWVVQQLQQIFPAVQRLNQAAGELQQQLKKEGIPNGSP